MRFWPKRPKPSRERVAFLRRQPFSAPLWSAAASAAFGNRRSVGPPPVARCRNNTCPQHAYRCRNNTCRLTGYGVETTPYPHSQPGCRNNTLSALSPGCRNNTLDRHRPAVETTAGLTGTRVSKQHPCTAIAEVSKQHLCSGARWTSPKGSVQLIGQSIPSSVGISRQCGLSQAFKRAWPSGHFNNRQDRCPILPPCSVRPAGPYLRCRSRGCSPRTAQGTVLTVIVEFVPNSPPVIVARLLHGASRWLARTNPNRICRCIDEVVRCSYGRFDTFGNRRSHLQSVAGGDLGAAAAPPVWPPALARPGQPMAVHYVAMNSFVGSSPVSGWCLLARYSSPWPLGPGYHCTSCQQTTPPPRLKDRVRTADGSAVLPFRGRSHAAASRGRPARAGLHRSLGLADSCRLVP